MSASTSAAYAGSAQLAGAQYPPGARIVAERSTIHPVTTTSAAPSVVGSVTGGVTYTGAPVTYVAGSTAQPYMAAATTQQPDGVVLVGQPHFSPQASVVSVPHSIPSAPATYAAPPQGYVVHGGSYVPPPSQQPPAMPYPSQPPSLTQGLPDPDAIETQKAAYSKSLEEQARHGEDMLKMQQKQQTDYIYQAAEAQKRQLICQIDQQAKQHELALTQKYSQQQMSLQQEYQHQKLVLEKQANDLAMEYQRRKAQEEMMSQQYEMQKAHYEDQMRIVTEMQKQHAAMQPQGMPPGPPGPMPMQPGPPMQPMAPAPQGSYVPPPMAYAAPTTGSYVPPPAPVPLAHAPSYAAPSAASHIMTAPTGGSYVPPPAACAPAYAAPTTYMGPPDNLGASTAPPTGMPLPMEPGACGAPMPVPTGGSQYLPPATYIPPATSYAASVAPSHSSYTVPPTQYAPSPYAAPATSYGAAPTAPNMYPATGEVPPTIMQPQMPGTMMPPGAMMPQA